MRLTYDQGTFGIGQRTSMFDPTGTTSLNYDSRGQVITQTQVITDSLGTFVTAWGYNSAGQQDWMKYPKNNLGQVEERIDYTYHNQLTLNSVLTIFPTAYVLDTAYDASGRILQRRMRNTGDVITQYAYYPWTTEDQGGRLQRIHSYHASKMLQDMQYTYDSVGNVTGIQDFWNLANGQPQALSFTYDALYRLRTAQAAGGNFGPYTQKQYTYDSITGNLASKDGLTYTYGDTNHKHAVTALSDGSLYTYDANGNMLTRQVGGQSFNLTHDAEGRLVSVVGAATASFGYNGDGQRVISTEGGTTTVFIGNYFEWTGLEATAVKYYYAESTRVAMRTGSTDVKWLLGDHLGSASVTYDGTNDLHQGYMPWGETRFGGLPTRYQFTGQYRHADLGIDFFNARWYDSRLGRFIEADTISPEASQGTQAWDRYAGMNNNPVRYNDPTGHFAFLATALVGAGIAMAVNYGI